MSYRGIPATLNRTVIYESTHTPSSIAQGAFTLRPEDYTPPLEGENLSDIIQTMWLDPLWEVLDNDTYMKCHPGKRICMRITGWPVTCYLHDFSRDYCRLEQKEHLQEYNRVKLIKTCFQAADRVLRRSTRFFLTRVERDTSERNDRILIIIERHQDPLYRSSSFVPRLL